MDPVEKILARKAQAFFLVAAGALGAVFREQTGLWGSAVVDLVLVVCPCVGGVLWADSKRLERRHRRERKKGTDEENKRAP